jgi:hypothetical protein
MQEENEPAGDDMMDVSRQTMIFLHYPINGPDPEPPSDATFQ